MSHITAIIPAAGQGSRMESRINKQFLLLNGKPVLAHTLSIFEESDLMNDIIVVVREDEVDYCSNNIVNEFGFKKVIAVVPGGKERAYSVANGLDKCSTDTDLVVVHDGARPLLTCALLEDVVNTALRTKAAVAAVPVKDCIKETTGGRVVNTPDRSKLWAVQTPQAFEFSLLKQAFNQPFPEQVYDDSMLVERLGGQVTVVRGSYANIKITTPEDLRVAAALMGESGCE